MGRGASGKNLAPRPPLFRLQRCPFLSQHGLCRFLGHIVWQRSQKLPPRSGRDDGAAAILLGLQIAAVDCMINLGSADRPIWSGDVRDVVSKFHLTSPSLLTVNQIQPRTRAVTRTRSIINFGTCPYSNAAGSARQFPERYAGWAQFGLKLPLPEQEISLGFRSFDQLSGQALVPTTIQKFLQDH